MSNPINDLAISATETTGVAPLTTTFSATFNGGSTQIGFVLFKETTGEVLFKESTGEILFKG